MGDAEHISSFLLYSSDALCADCLAWKTGLSSERVEAVLLALERDFRVTLTEGNCGRCLRDQRVISVG